MNIMDDMDETKITATEKAELLKDTIYQMWSKEGRSKSYISRLLKINRVVLRNKITEWDFPKADPMRHFSPRVQKFVNQNKEYIIKRLRENASITDIAKELGISRYSLQNTIIPNDRVLNQERNAYILRLKEQHIDTLADKISKSSREYILEEDETESWKPILGYDKYMVSNKGRVKGYAQRYGMWYVLQQTPNKNNSRLYVGLLAHTDTGKSKRQNLQVSRLVGHAFVDGYDELHNTINHKDGNVQNNNADNLEWVTQAENNLHAYRDLDRNVVNKKRYDFSKIVYNNKYEFKTVAAFAKFIGKSETQTRRYLDRPEEHNIKLIK